jgi:hypothetical protein
MRWVVNPTPRPLYPPERPSTHCTGGWVSPRAGLDGCGKSRPTGIRYPERTARSEWLHRLSYPGPFMYEYIIFNFFLIWHKISHRSDWATTSIFSTCLSCLRWLLHVSLDIVVRSNTFFFCGTRVSLHRFAASSIDSDAVSLCDHVFTLEQGRNIFSHFYDWNRLAGGAVSEMEGGKKEHVTRPCIWHHNIAAGGMERER